MRTFYLASSINSPGSPRGGTSLPVAQALVAALEKATGARCTSRWPFHVYQNQDDFLLLMATANVFDLAQAEALLFVPLTNSSRGAHDERGMALAMGKPVFMFSPPGRDPVAFDQLCLPMPPAWRAAIEGVLKGVV